MIRRDLASDDAAILRETIEGKSVQEIARQRGMTLAEVNHAIDAEAQRMFSGEGTRRAVAIEAQRLDLLKQKLWQRYMQEGDNPSAALFIKVSERLASMCGWNFPLGHVVQITGHLPQAHPETSRERLTRVLAELTGEASTAEPDDEEAPSEG